MAYPKLIRVRCTAARIEVHVAGQSFSGVPVSQVTISIDPATDPSFPDIAAENNIYSLT